MLMINGANIQIEGQLGDLIMEAARLVDSVASSIDKNSNGEIEYNDAVTAILAFLVQIKKMGDETNQNNFGYEMELEFRKNLNRQRKEHRGDPNWFEYDYHKHANGLSKALNTADITGGASLGDFNIDITKKK